MNTSYSHYLMKYLTIFLRFSFVLIIVILCTVLSFYVLKYAFPFVVAFILAIMLNPFVHWLESRLKCPRAVAVLFVMTSGLSIVIGMISLISAEIISGLSFLLARLPEQISTDTDLLGNYFYHHLVPFWDKVTRVFYALDTNQQSTILGNIKGLNQELTSYITNLGTKTLGSLTEILMRLPSALTILIIIFLATFFICKDWYRISNFLHQKLEKRIHGTLIQVFDEFKEAITGYFRAQFALMSITGAVMMVCLTILRVNNGLTISILTALVDFLPYIGTGAVLIPWGLYSFLTGQSVFALYLGLLYLLLVIIRQILEPKMLAVSIGLNPLATLISVFVGFKAFGLIGLFIGPGALVLIKSLTHANVFKTAWEFIISAPTK